MQDQDTNPAPLDRLLVSAERSTVKVKALVHATRAGDPASAEAVRKHIANETNPFVLATMASVLARAGTAGDAPLLAPLLDHADARVVANALQAYYLLKIDLAPDRLVELAKRDDPRVRANALAILGRYNPEFVMERIASLSESTDAVTRAGIAYLLGEMPGHAQVLKSLFRMLEVEERTGVLKQLGQSVTKHAVPAQAESVIGHLFELRGRVTGGKVALVAMLLQEVGVELGMVESEVTAIGERHLAAQAPKPVAATSTPRTREEVDTSLSGDVEISPSEIWGAPPPALKSPSTTAGRKRPADLGAPPVPVAAPAAVAPGRARWAAAAVCLLGVGWMALGDPTPAPVDAPRSEQVRVKPNVVMKTQLPTKVIVASTGGGGGGGGDVAALWKEPGVAERLGPVGAPVDVEGTVSAVSPGRAVIFCLGRYYVVRGRELERKAVGTKLRCRGRIQGIAASGLIYVDSEAS